jgi:hypothetical protein
MDGNRDIWRDAASAFAHQLNGLSGGAVMSRLEQVFLFASAIDITAVGDPRQHTYATNQSPKHKQYRGAGLLRWLDARKDVCVREDRQVSQRCHQDICDFASGLFPHFAPLESGHGEVTGHDGVHTITHYEALEYYSEYRPQVLRWDRGGKRRKAFRR